MSPSFDVTTGINERPVLTIDLDAVVHNYTQMVRLAAGAEVGAVVKANAYGCGIGPVSTALWASGCRTFFVATAAEGVELRSLLPQALIYVFAGLTCETAADYSNHNLSPILNSVAEIDLWLEQKLPPKPIGVYLDTGMTRLGLSRADVMSTLGRLEDLAGPKSLMVMSHLACSDNHDHPMNQEQLHLFNDLSSLLPFNSRSMANSDGVVLGPDFHFDLVRPGYALYGGSDALVTQAALHPVAHLHAPIVQVHKVDEKTSIGYGATYKIERPSRIAIVGLGYADGYSRALSNIGVGVLAGSEVPVAGRVSMDLTAFDVTDVGPDKARIGDTIELLGDHLSTERVGRLAGTLGYEVLTGLGHRYVRRYVQNGALIGD